MIQARYILVMLLIALSALSPAAAQSAARQPLPVDSLAGREARYLAHHLKLSEAQRSQVATLTRQNMQQMDSVRRLPAEAAAKTQTLTKQAKDYRAALKGLFTPEQYTGYEALVEGQRSKVGTRSKNVKELPQ